MVHETLHADVKGYIDDSINFSNFTYITGWAFHLKNGIRQLRMKYDNTIDSVQIISRKDVVDFYKRNDIIICGWKAKFPKGNFVDLQMNVDDEWVTIFSLNSLSAKDSSIVILDGEESTPTKIVEQPALPTTTITIDNIIKKFIEKAQIEKDVNKITSYELDTTIMTHIRPPTFVVVDNFYKNPDSVRNFALGLTFNEHSEYHKGKRTNECYRFDGLKEEFERIIGSKITNWDKYGTNGCFQTCIAGDQIVYHYDGQEYAGVLFLTPDAPPNTGTSFYRSKYTKTMKTTEETDKVVFKNGFLDSTEFEMVDTVGNVYNRLVLFDAKLIHAATQYFGNNLNNGRLFQLFFFDIDK
jgi:hypothetical protein